MINVIVFVIFKECIFKMELVSENGEISDDYEEGEILDDDNIFDEVSSVEELSGEEIESSSSPKNDSSEKSVHRTGKQHKKKEHKCKEDSVCRQERKGKHCYARIRKNKHSLAVSKIESFPEPIKENVLPKRLESGYISERSTRRPRHNSSSLTAKQSSIKTYKSEDKDYHEKENRYSNKKQWSNNEKSSRTRPRYSSKSYTRPKINRQHDSRYSSYSVLGSHRKRLDPVIDTALANQAAKSSLLKRLVGSGITGVKTLKENEVLSNCQINKTDTCNTNVSSKSVQKCSDLANDENSPLCSLSPKTEIEVISSPPVSLNENAESAQIVEPPGKMTVKWKRSMKDDNDELHLRVEALRSVWVKKSGERKRKGLIHRQKADGDDLVELLFDSDSDESINKDCVQEPSASLTNNKDAGDNLKSSEPKFNASDLSGDILKPEDMVIVAQDKCTDKPIICEPAVRIVTGVGNAVDSLDSVFIASSLSLFSQQNHEKPLERPDGRKGSVSLEMKLFKGSSTEVDVSKEISSYKKKISKSSERSKEHESKTNKHSNSKTIRDRKLHKSSKTEIKKSSRRRVRKKIKRYRKSSANSGELDDEIMLREQALLTLKSKINATNVSGNNNSEITDDLRCPNSLRPNEIQLEDKNLVRVSESEVCGATSSDNLEEDEDVDILRAQLLSSISKHVTELSSSLETDLVAVVNSHINIETGSNITQNIKTVVPRRQERKKLKVLNKGVWKQPDHLSQVNNKNRLKHYAKHNVFIKKDKVPLNNCNNVIPQVPKMIISVNDSDSGSDTDMGKSNNTSPEKSDASKNSSAEIEAKVDLLLREAEKNIQLTKFTVDSQSALSSQGDQTVLQSSEENNQVKKEKKSGLLSSGSSSTTLVPTITPQAVKHLPAWQQEEYRRLKKQIAEREHFARANKLNEYPKEVILNTSSSVGMEQISSISENNSPEPNNVSIEPCVVVDNKDSDLTANSGGESPKNNVPAEKPDTQFDKNDNNITYQSNNSSGDVQKEKSNFKSGGILDEIDAMNDMVNQFKKHSTDYSELRKKLNRYKKLIKCIESKISAEKTNLFEIQKKIEADKERISSNISSATVTQPLSTDKKNKAFTREMELINLKYREVSLKAQVLFQKFSFENSANQKKKGITIDNVVTDSQKNKAKDKLVTTTTVSPAKKRKTAVTLPSASASDKEKDIPEPSAKRCFSGKERERGEWDPDTPVCHYDLNGICRDEECKYQHFKTI